ncbi:MAG: M23 family metallopeptidase, partial [Verrucomicrobiales bacterium]|nr:M23 family metallopeptidase [Verrucomicrobiales bacterium]
NRVFWFLVFLTVHGAHFATSQEIVVFPIEGGKEFSNLFGQHAGGTRYHSAVDIPRTEEFDSRLHVPVFAIADGIVKFSAFVSRDTPENPDTGYGHVVVIEHEFSGIGKVCSVYGHLSSRGLIDNEVRVHRGDLIGFLTNETDQDGTGRHLHIGLRKGGYSTESDGDGKWRYRGYTKSYFLDDWIDPVEFFKERAFHTFSSGSRVRVQGSGSGVRAYENLNSGSSVTKLDGSTGAIIRGPIQARTPSDGVVRYFWEIDWDNDGVDRWSVVDFIGWDEMAIVAAFIDPVRANPGESIQVSYYFEAEQGGSILLGAGIDPSNSTISWDSANVVRVEIPSQASSVRSRRLEIPDFARPGLYNLTLEAWRDQNGNGRIDRAVDVQVAGSRFASQITVLGDPGGGTGGGGGGEYSIQYRSHEIDDTRGGNGDGEVGPGEAIEIPLTLENDGDYRLTGVEAKLLCEDPCVTISDSSLFFGTINSGMTDTLADFDAIFDSDCRAGDVIEFQLRIEADQGVWLSSFSVRIADAPLPKLTYFRTVVFPNRITPGEQFFVDHHFDAEDSIPIVVEVDIKDKRDGAIYPGDEQALSRNLPQGVGFLRQQIATDTDFRLSVFDLTVYVFADLNRDGEANVEDDKLLEIRTLKNALSSVPCRAILHEPLPNSSTGFPWEFRWSLFGSCPAVHVVFTDDPTPPIQIAFSAPLQRTDETVSEADWEQIRASIGNSEEYYWTIAVDLPDIYPPGPQLARWAPFRPNPILQPDVWSSPNTILSSGKGVFSRNPYSHYFSLTSRRARKKNGIFYVENAGSIPDSFALRCLRNNRYVRQIFRANNLNQTAALITGVFTTAEVLPSERAERVLAEFRPNRKALKIKRKRRNRYRKKRKILPLFATSLNDSTAIDTVSFLLKMR